MRWLLLALGVLLPAASVAAVEGGRTLETAASIRNSGLDPDACYRVRDVVLAREDLRVYLTEGFLIFGRPVNGRRYSAVFSAEVEGGDAELLLMPPHRSERMALAGFTSTPNLNEHFRSAVFLFTDSTALELMDRIKARESERGRGTAAPEMGRILAANWDQVVKNFSSSFEIRLVHNLLSPEQGVAGFFYGALASARLGNFDIIYDPHMRKQITVGQVLYRDNQTFFDVWTSFESRSVRSGARTMSGPGFSVERIRIDTTIEPDLHLNATTKITIKPDRLLREPLAFAISRQMRVSEARIDGRPVEVFQRESLRAGLLRGDRNMEFLVMGPEPLQPGRSYEIEFRHEGEVVSSAGNGVFFVGSRGTWYPNGGAQSFSLYDLTFRYPKELDLVATGEVVEDRIEEQWRITRRTTSAPIRLAGFNLGNYERSTATRRGYTVSVYANKQLESALQKSRDVILMPPPELTRTWPQRSRIPTLLSTVPDPRPPARTRLDQLATNIASAFEFMAARFGPPPFSTLTVSPIPGMFGQGFPGLIYLSTLSYLEPRERPPSLRAQNIETFFSEVIDAHETAHQWWGNLVAAEEHQDVWIMEALANYSALLYLEKKNGTPELESILNLYKANLLAPAPDGRPIDSAGPITWGTRLHSSQTPSAWKVITYEKGSWIVHMLRRRLGDEPFFAMLNEMAKRYRFRNITTEQFRQLAAEFTPKGSPDAKLEAFFEQWVYGTGIPALKLNYSAKGKPPSVRISGTVEQSEVDPTFSILVPVEIQFGKKNSIVRWVRTSEEPEEFSVTVPQPPVRVVMDPSDSVLKR
ncbi:MAG: hypothetical protein LC130_31180 [Bryobacterales bacterium]|nr:hypothetical protein [Bryobacterales bacterium]MEB2362676.1 M1 family aminopeptidase [Bryobacterales bacterium]